MLKKIVGLLSVGILILSLAGIVSAQEIKVAGATSLVSLIEELAAKFEEETGVKINVKGGGERVAIMGVNNEKLDIAVMARHLMPMEQKMGLTPTAFGTAAFVIVVNKGNLVDSISKDQASKIFEGEIGNWSEVGGNNARIVVINQKTGTSDRMMAQMAIIGSMDMTRDVTKKAIEVGSYRDLNKRVSSFPLAVGYIFSSGAGSNVKALDIEGIELTPENVMNGKYPYTWELLLVTKGEPQGKIKEFIDLARSPEGVEIIKKAGYFMHTGGGMGGMHSEGMEMKK